MTIRQSERKPGHHENCITEERLNLPISAKSSVRKRKEFEKGKTFIRVPIFRGYILKEVKNE